MWKVNICIFHKLKMANGRHIENQKFAITLQRLTDLDEFWDKHAHCGYNFRTYVYHLYEQVSECSQPSGFTSCSACYRVLAGPCYIISSNGNAGRQSLDCTETPHGPHSLLEANCESKDDYRQINLDVHVLRKQSQCICGRLHDVVDKRKPFVCEGIEISS